jgi:hypothetical protein
MPLITCPECRRDISDRALSCPGCGNPMRAIVIEATAKRWKALQLTGIGVFAAGILAAIFSVWIADWIYQNAFFGFVKPTEASIDNALIALTYWRHRMGLYALWLLCGGVVLFATGRIAGWWYHG